MVPTTASAAHQHARAGLARHRALEVDHVTTTAARSAASQSRAESCTARFICARYAASAVAPCLTTWIASSTASAVAGARSGGSTRVPADRRHRVADREEHRERQQQRRLADGLAAVDAVGHVVGLRTARTLNIGGQSLAVGIL